MRFSALTAGRRSNLISKAMGRKRHDTPTRRIRCISIISVPSTRPGSRPGAYRRCPTGRTCDVVHRLLAEEAAIPIARAFMAEYPGIEVLHNRMVGADIGKTVLAEAKAGAEIGDVFDRTNTVVSLAPAGMIEP